MDTQMKLLKFTWLALLNCFFSPANDILNNVPFLVENKNSKISYVYSHPEVLTLSIVMSHKIHNRVTVYHLCKICL